MAAECLKRMITLDTNPFAETWAGCMPDDEGIFLKEKKNQ